MEHNRYDDVLRISVIAERTINNEKIDADEFFKCIANISDCDIFQRISSKKARDKVYVSLKEALPVIKEKYWTYKAILIAIEKSLTKQEERNKREAILAKEKEEQRKNNELKIKEEAEKAAIRERRKKLREEKKKNASMPPVIEEHTSIKSIAGKIKQILTGKA